MEQQKNEQIKKIELNNIDDLISRMEQDQFQINDTAVMIHQRETREKEILEEEIKNNEQNNEKSGLISNAPSKSSSYLKF